jgi:argininosuccinate synthase
VNKERIVLAYSGSLASSAAIAWLLERHGADVVALTIDVGQTEDLEEVRARALACGALRAHVVDARDAFARDYVVPALARGVIDAESWCRLADPLIASTLADIAAIESADAIAHAAAGEGSHQRGAALDAALAAAAPALPVVAPAREWRMDAGSLADYARARSLPGALERREPHLLIRRAGDPARAPQAAARLDLSFEDGVPVSLNGVPMTLVELIESVSLIAGQYGLGHGAQRPVPAAVVLRAAYGAARGRHESVRLSLRPGTYEIEMGSEVISGGHSGVADPLAAGVLDK